MKRFLLFFSLNIFGVIVSFGQNYFGLLKDKQGEKLPYISVMLKNSEDSSFVSGTVSDENGSFTIRKPQHQKCYLLFSGIGYYDHKISLEEQQGDSVNIGNVIMEHDEKQLKEVVVTGKRRVIFQNGEYKLAVSGLSLERLPDFKDRRLTLIISGNDLFRKSLPNNSTYIYNIESSRTLSPDSRNVTISLRYNINKFKMSFKKNNSNDEEESRISK